MPLSPSVTMFVKQNELDYARVKVQVLGFESPTTVCFVQYISNQTKWLYAHIKDSTVKECEAFLTP